MVLVAVPFDLYDHVKRITNPEVPFPLACVYLVSIVSLLSMHGSDSKLSIALVKMIMSCPISIGGCTLTVTCFWL
jgi:hypothetical protein